MIEGNKYNKKKKRESRQGTLGEVIHVGLIEQRGGVGEGLDLADI